MADKHMNLAPDSLGCPPPLLASLMQRMTPPSLLVYTSINIGRNV